MPEYTVEEAGEQALKAAAYFGRVLSEHSKTFIVASVDGVTIVVATDKHGAELEHLIETDNYFGKNVVISRPPLQGVTLIPRFHEPGSRGKGSIHLHVLNGATFGRRVRASGECLCSKKHGSSERAPKSGETTMCSECVRLAASFGLTWTLD